MQAAPDDLLPDPVARVLAQLAGVRRCGNGWRALCPAHDDHSPSLSVKEGDHGCCVLNCFAGCDPQEVIRAVGLEWADLFRGSPNGRRPARLPRRNQTTKPLGACPQPPEPLNHPRLGRPTISWPIHDSQGALAAVHCRFDREGGKEVRWWRGEWSLGGLATSDLPLYGSHLLTQADTSVCRGPRRGRASNGCLASAGHSGNRHSDRRLFMPGRRAV